MQANSDFRGIVAWARNKLSTLLDAEIAIVFTSNAIVVPSAIYLTYIQSKLHAFIYRYGNS